MAVTCYNRLSFGDGYSNYVEFCFHNSNCTKAEEKELQKSCRCRLSFRHVVYVCTQQWAARAINATPILNREKRIRLQALLIYKHTFTSCGDISACAYIRNSTVYIVATITHVNTLCTPRHSGIVWLPWESVHLSVSDSVYKKNKNLEKKLEHSMGCK